MRSPRRTGPSAGPRGASGSPRASGNNLEAIISQYVYRYPYCQRGDESSAPSVVWSSTGIGPAPRPTMAGNAGRCPWYPEETWEKWRSMMTFCFESDSPSHFFFFPRGPDSLKVSDGNMGFRFGSLSSPSSRSQLASFLDERREGWRAETGPRRPPIPPYALKRPYPSSLRHVETKDRVVPLGMWPRPSSAVQHLHICMAGLPPRPLQWLADLALPSRLQSSPTPDVDRYLQYSYSAL